MHWLYQMGTCTPEWFLHTTFTLQILTHALLVPCNAHSVPGLQARASQLVPLLLRGKSPPLPASIFNMGFYLRSSWKAHTYLDCTALLIGSRSGMRWEIGWSEWRQPFCFAVGFTSYFQGTRLGVSIWDTMGLRLILQSHEGWGRGSHLAQHQAIISTRHRIRAQDLETKTPGLVLGSVSYSSNGLEHGISSLLSLFSYLKNGLTLKVVGTSLRMFHRLECALLGWVTTRTSPESCDWDSFSPSLSYPVFNQTSGWVLCQGD